MGNSNKAQNNVVHLEFLTAKQKVKKDKALAKHKVEHTQDDQLEDVIIIQDFTQYYEADLRETIYTSDESIQVKKIVDLIVSSNSNTPPHLLKISQFFYENVKSYQIFFNNQLYCQDEQQYKFTYEPLYVEVIYKPKHWLERATAKLKYYSSKTINAISLIARFAYLAIPIYTSLSSLQPFLLPTLKTAKTALKATHNPKAQSASVALKILIHGLQYATMIAAPIFALVSKYIPATKTIALGLGVYFGKGAIWNIAKLGITIFCPLLTPLLMLLG